MLTGARALRAALCAPLVLTLALGLALFPAHGGSAELTLTGFALEAQDTTLAISVPLALKDGIAVRERLKHGAQLRLAAHITVEQKRSWAMNRTLAETDQTLQLRYDPLIREYVLTNGGALRQFKTLEQLLGQAWNDTPLRVRLKTPIVSGETYLVALTLTLRHDDVSSWLKKVLFFWPWEITPPLTFTQTVQF